MQTLLVTGGAGFIGSCFVRRAIARADVRIINLDKLTYVRDRPGHDRRYAIDASKIAAEPGWKPQQDFESGLELTVRWYLENHVWVSRVRSGSYRGERLGLAD